MAVCGRCLICGHKFSGDEADEAIRWACTSDKCQEHRERARRVWDETYEHAICVWCHDALMAHDELKSAVSDLLDIVRRISERNKSADGVG